MIQIKVTEKNGKRNFENFLAKVRKEVSSNLDEVQDTLFWSIMGIASWIDPKPVISPEFRYVYDQYLQYLSQADVEFYYLSQSGFGIGWLNATELDDATQANNPVTVVVEMYQDKELRTITYNPQRIVPYWRLLEWGQYLEKEKNISPNPKTLEPRPTDVWYLPIGEITSSPGAGKPLTYFTYNPRSDWESTSVPAFEVLKKLWAKTYPDFKALVGRAIAKHLPQKKGG